MRGITVLRHCLFLTVACEVKSVAIKKDKYYSSLAHSSQPELISERLFQLPLTSTSVSDEWSQSQALSLLQPREYEPNRSIITRPKPAKSVRYTGERLCDGACISVRSCDHHGGYIQGQCSNGNACCVFQKTCGAVSREKVSFFRSPYYPIFNNQSMECSYRVYPNENTCALRVDFLQFSLKRPKKYPKVEKCNDDIMFLLNSAQGAAEGICEMENHTAVVEVVPNSSHPIIFMFVTQSNNYLWNLKITQVNCKKISPWKNRKNCGRQLMYEPNEFDSDRQPSSAGQDEYHQYRMNGEGHSTEPQLPQPVPYIVNGKDAEAREFPWQISLQFKDKSSHRCGGTVLDERHVLTAAHCVFRNSFVSKNELKVAVGDLILNTEKDGQHEDYEIEKLIVNFNYKPSDSHVNDIAVIKLNKAIRFNEKVQPICLLDEEFEVYGKNAVVTGWGYLDGQDPSAAATKLQKLNVNIISNEKCKEMVKVEFEEILKRNLSYQAVGRSNSMGRNDLQICALSKQNSSACFGDSGGPLVIQNEEDGRYIQVGIVSYGLGKCRTDRQIPGSYTNIKKYLKFIAIATSEDPTN